MIETGPPPRLGFSPSWHIFYFIKYIILSCESLSAVIQYAEEKNRCIFVGKGLIFSFFGFLFLGRCEG